MGLDTTSLGFPLFFIILLPGFMFFISFRWAARYTGKVGEFGSICTSALFGILLFLAWKSSVGNNITVVSEFVANPLFAGTCLAISGLIIGALLGWPIGWLRFKFR
jgi:hypothetical protein